MSKDKSISAYGANWYEGFLAAVVIAFTVALSVYVIQLIPGNNGFSGSWFQVLAAVLLTIVGAWDLLNTPKGFRVKPAIIFFLSLFIVITGQIGAINSQ